MNKYPQIEVETIGYYHSNSNEKATPDLLPKMLNSNKQFFENPDLPVPFMDLKIDYPKIMEMREKNLSSVLDYIQQKGWPDGNKPDFVTDRYLLKSIVAPESTTTLHIVRVDGVIYMNTLDEEPVGNSGYRWVFKHILTRVSVDDPFDTEPIIRKAMFKATIPAKGEKYTVLYSGKVDAIDEDNKHYEIKVAASGTNHYFWEQNSYRLSWQMLFGDMKSIIVGARTGKFPGDPKTRKPTNYPSYSIYKVEKFDRDVFFKKSNSFLKRNHSKRQFENGKKDLQDLLVLVKNTLTEDGDGFVFSRSEDNPEWKIRRDGEAVADFRGLILKNISNI